MGPPYFAVPLPGTVFHCKRFVFRHVQVNNEEAIAFYQKFGFEIRETKENYYKRITPADALVLQVYKNHSTKAFSQVLNFQGQNHLECAHCYRHTNDSSRIFRLLAENTQNRCQVVMTSSGFVTSESDSSFIIRNHHAAKLHLRAG